MVRRLNPVTSTIAPRQAQLTIERDKLRVDTAMKTRPLRTVDALFKSAAQAYGERVVGVILSGMQDDGTEGCREIRKHGGITIAQDPIEAEYSSMPDSAMRDTVVHYCLPAAEIANKVRELVTGASAPSISQNARVMIVEDEWMLASRLERQLTDLQLRWLAP